MAVFRDGIYGKFLILNQDYQDFVFLFWENLECFHREWGTFKMLGGSNITR